MEHWHCRHVLGNPFQHRVGTALDMIGHHQMPDRKILAPFGDECEVSGYRLPVPGRLPGPNLKSGSQTSVRTRRIFILSSVIKKLLFHSIGALLSMRASSQAQKLQWASMR